MTHRDAAAGEALRGTAIAARGRAAPARPDGAGRDTRERHDDTPAPGAAHGTGKHDS